MLRYASLSDWLLLYSLAKNMERSVFSEFILHLHTELFQESKKKKGKKDKEEESRKEDDDDDDDSSEVKGVGFKKLRDDWLAKEEQQWPDSDYEY